MSPKTNCLLYSKSSSGIFPREDLHGRKIPRAPDKWRMPKIMRHRKTPPPDLHGSLRCRTSTTCHGVPSTSTTCAESTPVTTPGCDLSAQREPGCRVHCPVLSAIRADAATTISAGAIFSLTDSLSANNSATQPRLVSFSLTKHPLGWDPAETNSPSHNTSHRTRIRSSGHPGPKLHIGRESDLQATQGQSFTSDENPIFRPPRAKALHRTRIRSIGHPGQSFTSDENPIFRPPRAKASHRTRIRSSGHPGPKLYIGRESDLQATQGQSFTSDENPIFRPPRAKALHRTRIRSSGHPGPKLYIGRESDLQATQGQSFTSDENPIFRPPRAKI